MASTAHTGDSDVDQITGGDPNTEQRTGPLTVEELRRHAEVNRNSRMAQGGLPAAVDMHTGPRKSPPPRADGRMPHIQANAIQEGPFHPSPSLDPKGVQSLEGFEGAQDMLTPVVSAFSNAYVGLEQLAKARAQADKNPAWPDAQKLLNVGGLAEKLLDRATKSFDTAHKNLNDFVTALDKSLSAPLEGSAHSPLAKEIREYLRSLPEGERAKFVSTAINNGDKNVVSAMCGVPHYLAGLMPSQQEDYLRRWNEKANPVAVQRLAIARRALEVIQARAPLILTETERAMRGTFAKIKAVREANSLAEQALIMQDGTI